MSGLIVFILAVIGLAGCDQVPIVTSNEPIATSEPGKPILICQVAGGSLTHPALDFDFCEQWDDRAAGGFGAMEEMTPLAYAQLHGYSKVLSKRYVESQHGLLIVMNVAADSAALEESK